MNGPFNVSSPQRGGAVPAPLERGGPKWRDNYPEESDRQAIIGFGSLVVGRLCAETFWLWTVYAPEPVYFLRCLIVAYWA